MAGPDPSWQESIAWIAATGSAAIGGIFMGFRKAKGGEDVEAAGAAQVVTASFVDKAALDKNTAAIVDMNEQLKELNQHMRTAEQFRHDERIAKDAAAHALLEARLGGKT